MIKSIEITNFESHEHSRIDFSRGLNTIVGRSNSGKSSIIRAASIAVANKWSKEQVRNGCEFCRIRVDTDRGWVECERGEKINRWKCFANGEDSVQEYRSVGIGVPDKATEILGMSEVSRGDFKEMPNFMFQLDKHYMLSEIDGKKATANMVARMMDNAIGLGGMEDLIRDLSADLMKDRKWLTEKQNEIIELKSELIDDAIFKGYEDADRRISELSEYVSETEGGIADAERTMDDYGKSLARSESNARELSRFSDLSSLSGKYGELSGMKARIDAMSSAASVGERISRLSSMDSVDCGSMERKLSEVSGILSRIEGMERELSSARSMWRRSHDLDAESKSASSELRSASSDLESLKKRLGVCPVCGGRLS